MRMEMIALTTLKAHQNVVFTMMKTSLQPLTAALVEEDLEAHRAQMTLL